MRAAGGGQVIRALDRLVPAAVALAVAALTAQAVMRW
jgi:phage baseplate assembly protein W